jgi:hypothetical protein
MFKRLLSKKVSGLTSTPVRNYDRLSTEQYLINTRNSLTNTNLQKANLTPLLEANHTADTNTHLYGVPQVPYEKKHLDMFTEIVAEKMPDLIFL